MLMIILDMSPCLLGEPCLSLPHWPLRGVLIVSQESAKWDSFGEVHQVRRAILAESTSVLVVA